MKVPWKWLKEYVPLPWDPEETARRFTEAGLKVENLTHERLGVSGVVSARIVQVRPHPKRPGLRVGVLDIGKERLTVVSGAKNFRDGRVVLLALPGASLPSGVIIRSRDFEGEVSQGMVLCSNELLTGQGPRPGEDIVVLPDDTPSGIPAEELFDLDDWVIDLELTVNFSHCLSILGVAIEASALSGVPLRLPEVLSRWSWDGPLGCIRPGQADKEASLERYRGTHGEAQVGANVGMSEVAHAEMLWGAPRISVSLPDPDLCPRYVGKIVEGLEFGYSPVKVERRLLLAGMRPLNSIVDATNYVMLETGQPLHAFDLDKLEGRTIYARRAKPNESIVTLDGETRSLEPGTLVIADERGPVAIAGVMGGRRSEVTGDTRSILLESAYFAPLAVRLTSQKQNLRTEAALRFEKGVDPTAQVAVAERAADFIREVAGGVPCPGWAEENLLDSQPREIILGPDTVRRYLGVNIPKETCRRIFSALKFCAEEEPSQPGALVVTVPPRRVDIQEEVDLLEEIARLHGYHNFPPRDLTRAVPGGPPNREYSWVDRLRDFLVSMGGFEVVTNSLLSPKEVAALGWDEGDRRGKPVTLRNPLSSAESVLRTSLLPGILKVIRLNQRSKVSGGLFFEIGRVFLEPEVGRTSSAGEIRPPFSGGLSSSSPAGVIPEREDLPWEEAELALGSYGTLSPKSWSQEEKKASFFHMKGVIDGLMNLLGIEDMDYLPGAGMPFHPGKSAKILVKGSCLGEIGEIHPVCQKALDVAEAPVLDWLALGAVLAVAREARFEPVSRFMPVERDLAVVVAEEVPAGEVLKAVKEVSRNLVSVSLFDVWRGQPVPEGKKSLAIRLTYQAWEKAFTEEELAQERAKIMARLEKEFGAEIRG